MAQAPAFTPSNRPLLGIAASAVTSIIAFHANAGAAVPDTAPARVYIIPLEGQLGTDVHPMYTDKVIADAKAAKPDLIVFRLNMTDKDTNDYLQNDDRKEMSMFDDDQARRLVKSLKEELSGTPQVVWVQDCVGFGFLLAFGWPDMYMSEGARLWGPTYQQIAQRQQHPDTEVQRKFREAMNAITGGFIQAGGYDAQMAECFLRPDKVCSVNLSGRAGIKWRDDTKGMYVLDASDKDLLRLNSETAGEIGLADGIVPSDPDDGLEELLFDRGILEPEVITSGQTVYEEYRDAWRKALEQAQEYLRDAQEQKLTDPLKELSRQRGLYDKVLKIVERYQAVERRLGVSPTELKVRIGQIDEQRKQLQRQKREGDGGGSGSGGRNGRGFGGGGGKGLGT